MTKQVVNLMKTGSEKKVCCVGEFFLPSCLTSSHRTLKRFSHPFFYMIHVRHEFVNVHDEKSHFIRLSFLSGFLLLGVNCWEGIVWNCFMQKGDNE